MQLTNHSILETLQQQWNGYFERIGHDFQFLTRSLEIQPGCSLILSRLGNYRRRRALSETECGLCQYLEPEAALSHPSLALDGTYYFHVNIYPTVPYVVIFSHREHISMEVNVTNYPRDLRQMLRMAEITGTSIFHNMRDAASSIPEHEHFQGLLFAVPIQHWPMEIVEESSEIQLLTIPAIPGENYVFQGTDPVPAVLDYIGDLEDIPYTLAILSRPSRIMVFPRRQEKSIYPERRWGGTEMLGTVACRQEMFELDDRELAEQILKNYRHVLYPRGELAPARVRAGRF